MPGVLVKKWAVQALGRHTPTLLRYIAHRNPFNRGRYAALCALNEDPRCKAWLDSLENPTRTRLGFEIFTIKGDLTSDWIKLHGQHETGTERFLLEHLPAGSTFLDIGANIGYFSLVAAVAADARVVAFEPQGFLASLVQRSATHNGVIQKLSVRQLALSNVSATMRMTKCPGNTGHSQLTAIDDPNGEIEQVRVEPLDRWLETNPLGPIAACKIDTEGAEMKILEGMSGMLKRQLPALVVEVEDEFLRQFGSNAKEVTRFLEGIGYSDATGDYSVEGDRNKYFVKTVPKSAPLKSR